MSVKEYLHVLRRSLLVFTNGDAIRLARGRTTYTITDTFTSIAAYAFFSWSNDFALLHTVIIPNTITSVGHSAFYNCRVTITLPNTITSIPSYMFRGCSSITSITVPSYVSSIGALCFYNCCSLKSITISDRAQ